jgi:hypothetical protein
MTAATAASAQTSGSVPQPQRLSHGGTDKGARNLMPDGTELRPGSAPRAQGKELFAVY